ncbi:U-box domain-containing protein 44-like [Magnolia sinica]|uniref:U-box domain-containing protein 44-like n=1 Tax=Magnolia sinica TaxID=86752 RepID=UPI00265A4387|nr:U-box domain-containing protein 44-like [Magnolia sinica]
MLSLDMAVDPMTLVISSVQELCTRIAKGAMELQDEAEDVMIDKESFRQFSNYISEIKILLQTLHAGRVEATVGSTSTKETLQALESQLREACKIIEKYKSGSRLRLLLNCESVLSQMGQLALEIANTVSLLGTANLNTVLSLKSKIDQIVGGLQSMEFKYAAKTEAIVSEIERLMAQNGRNREHTVRLLQKVAEAVGVGQNASLVRTELELLKQEKEEMEAQKKQAEALQLSQLMQFLNSSGLASGRRGERTAASSLQDPTPFMCPLCNEVMEDPVVINCGHGFERRVILEHFDRGERTCPICGEELQSLDLIPNHTLRSTIQEWRQRDMDAKLHNAVAAIASDDPDVVNQALEDLQDLMKAAQYRAAVTEQKIIPRIVELLEGTSDVTTKAALKCLCYLANYSDDNKEAIAEAGAIRYIMKHFYRGEVEPDAVSVLIELSQKEALAEQIGKATDCIPFLVSLLQNCNPDISQKAEKVVENLSYNTHFVIKMAEARHFQPFVIRFSQGPQETQASMALTLLKMQLDDNSMKIFEDKRFVGPLVRLLSSSSPACKSACLQTIKKLSVYPGIAKQILAENATIPDLLGLISIYSSEQQWKQIAAEAITSLVEASDLSDFQTNSKLQELHSEHNISVFLNFAIGSVPQTKAQFWRLLLMIGNKSETARNLIRTDDSAMAHLFSSLNEDHPEVTRQTLKLIYCIANNHPDGVPLPPSPAKEAAINALVAIFTRSPDNEDRSMAAGIISQLPADDTAIDGILRKSEALKAIREVICTADNDRDMGFNASMAPDGSLLENALAALLRYTEPTKPDLRRQLSELELYPSLVRVLSRGSSIAKQRTATALAHLSQSDISSVSSSSITVSTRDSFMSLLWLTRHLPNTSWCCSSSPAWQWGLCSVHGSVCSSRHEFCLIKANAVKPLVKTLSETESGAAEAALLALESLLKDDNTLLRAATEIVKSQGVVGILEVLEKGSLPAKEKALDLLQKISEHIDIKSMFRRSERILIQLLHDESLKKKAALILRQMDVISKQSSYF